MEVRSLIAQLQTDPWRIREGFSRDVAIANDRLFSENSDQQRQAILAEWLGLYQPCLFGRLAARAGALTICVLSPQDLERDDDYIKAKIQSARKNWSRAAYAGKTSGFVLAAVAPILANATPEAHMLEVAKRLAFLYLRVEVSIDSAHLEDICLEIPGDERETWLWRAGVNYFSATGDRRWWNDHRIPGGMAFSVNSVGHLVKSGKLATDANTLNVLMGIRDGSGTGSRIDALPKALEFAMRTIAMASDAVSGKATELLPKSAECEHPCPVALPPNLADKNHCEYRGWYDTDQTLPPEYFVPDVKRPASVTTHTLDFTYLFDPSVEDGDFDLMGEGRRIRVAVPEQRRRSASVRANRGSPLRVPIAKLPLLQEALAQD